MRIDFVKDLPRWRRAALASGACLAVLGAIGGAAIAQDRLPSATPAPSVNMYGASGLIDMPSGESQPDGQLNITTAHFGPISRTTLTFQITPRLSGSFRFLGIRDWNRRFCPPIARVKTSSKPITTAASTCVIRCCARGNMCLP